MRNSLSDLTENLDEEQKENLQDAKTEILERMETENLSYDEVEEILLEYGFEMDYIFEILL